MHPQLRTYAKVPLSTGDCRSRLAGAQFGFEPDLELPISYRHFCY